MTNEVSKATAHCRRTESGIAAPLRDELQRAGSAALRSRTSLTRGCRKSAQSARPADPRQELDESHSRDLIAEAQLASAKSELRVEQNNETVIAKARRSAPAHHARLHHHHRSVRRHRNQTICSSGSMQSGRNAPAVPKAMPLARLQVGTALRLSLPGAQSLVSTIVVPGEARRSAVKQNIPLLPYSFKKGTSGALRRQGGHGHPRLMITEVDVPNPTGAIMPGMYAEVSLQAERRRAHSDRAVGRPRTQWSHCPRLRTGQRQA